MRFNPNISFKELEIWGFKKSKEHWEDEDTQWYSEYFIDLGHSRRSQSYYLLVHEDRTVSIFASKPDGDGSNLILTELLVSLILSDIFIR
jgi:hypothetical protein